MRVTDGVIYLVQPLFGRTILTGSFLVMTTWLDFTFHEELTPADLGLPPTAGAPAHVRVFIPLTNVVAVLAERDEQPASMTLPVLEPL